MPAHPDALNLRQYGASRGSHAHAHFQVLLGLEGTLALEVHGKERRLAPGDGCVITPGARHDFEALDGAQCLVLDSANAAWARCPPQPSQAGVARALALYLKAALSQGSRLALHHVPALLLDCWRPALATPARAQRAIDWPGLQHWAQRHAHEPLSVADLARQVFLSPSQFATRCRQETGLSPMQWLRQLRLAQAREWRASGLSVAQTALRCGYRSASALTAAMRLQHPPDWNGTNLS